MLLLLGYTPSANAAQQVVPKKIEHGEWLADPFPPSAFVSSLVSTLTGRENSCRSNICYDTD